MIGLVDCNNFYASCERVFNPKVEGKPVVVLSNNDGCVIARSNEAKELGIEMGDPAFLNKEKFEKLGIQVFSSNYALYGDLSERVMKSLSEFAMELEVYSIDEAFMSFKGYDYFNLETYASEIRTKVKQWTGVPVSIGIAPTKTLAKVANRFAKKMKREIRVHVLDNPEKLEAALKYTKVEDIWGIGRQYSRFLGGYGIHTAYDLSKANDAWIRRNLSITGLRMLNELRGIPCIELDEVAASKKGICTSRSYGAMLTDYEAIKEATANYASKCAEKLRRQNTCANNISVFLQTNSFNKQDKQYSNWKVLQLPVATNSTPEIIQYALLGLKMIYRAGYRYKKSGVIVTGIVPDNQVQRNLFDNSDENLKGKTVLSVMDKLNKSLGRDVIKFGAQGFSRKWKLRQEMLSPCYTTRLKDILTIQV